MPSNVRLSTARKAAIGVLSVATLGVAAFALFGNDAGSVAPQESVRSTKSTAERVITSSTRGSGAQPAPAAHVTATSKKTTAAAKKSTSHSSHIVPVPSVPGLAPAAAAKLAEDAVGEIADQLNDTVDTVGATLDQAGADLDAVTSDVLELVQQGVPLQDAVTQVLDQLPVVPTVSTPPLPVPSSVGGVVDGLLGGH